MMTLPTMPGHSFSIPGLGDVPVGSVTAYAGTLDTPGAGGAQDHTSVLEASAWMLCDGRELACAQYPQLFAVLGYVYGGADGTFRIPDYRGCFLRGVSAGTNNDPDEASRTRPPGGQGLDNGVGSRQSSSPTQENTRDGTPAPVAASPAETRPLNVYVNYIIKFTYGIRPMSM